MQKVAAGNAAAAALFAAGKPKPAWTTAEGRPTAGDIVRITSSVNDLLVEDICNVLKDTTDGAPYTLAKIGGPKLRCSPPVLSGHLFFSKVLYGPDRAQGKYFTEYGVLPWNMEKVAPGNAAAAALMASTPKKQVMTVGALGPNGRPMIEEK